MHPGVATADEAVRAAVAASHLAGLSAPMRERMFLDAVRIRAAAGTLVRREGDPGPHVELVIRGLIRMYVSSPDGRTLTVRYCRPGALIGVVSLFRPSYAMPGGMQALVDSELVALRATELRKLAAIEPDVATALLQELSERVVEFVTEIPGSAFATVRQRVARHLLDLASARQHGPELVARVSQQELAEAVGSVREVVVRVLGDLRRSGLVETGRSGVVLLDADRLASEVFSPEVTQVPPGPDAGP